MPDLTPMISLSTFLASLFIVLMAGRGIIEYIEYVENRKSAGMGASKKATQQYFKRKGA